MTSSTKPEVHNVSERRLLSHGHRQHAQKFGEDRLCGFWVMRADRQTDKQTYSSQYFAPLLGSK